MHKNINLAPLGKTFGKLTVVALHPARMKSGCVQWECACACGGKALKITSSLTRKFKQLGCMACKPQSVSDAKRRHGCARRNLKSRLYRIWCGMRSRCSLVTNPDYPGYGAKGVTVCAGWDRFEDFKSWAMANGYADDLTIDRLKSSGNYEPSNCEWVTRAINSSRAAVGARAKKKALSPQSLPGSSKNAVAR